MKRMLCSAVLVLIAAGLSGCFISVNEGCKPSKDQPQDNPCSMPVDTAIAEIDAVKNLSTDTARLNVLMAIAQRPGLSPQARVHLVESVTMLSTDQAREQVLMALAQNVPPMPPMPQPQLQPLPSPEPLTAPAH